MIPPQAPPVAAFDLTDITVLRYPAWYAADVSFGSSIDSAVSAKPVITSERPDKQAWERHKKGLHQKTMYATLPVINRPAGNSIIENALTIRRKSR